MTSKWSRRQISANTNQGLTSGAAAIASPSIRDGLAPQFSAADKATPTVTFSGCRIACVIKRTACEGVNLRLSRSVTPRFEREVTPNPQALQAHDWRINRARSRRDCETVGA